MTGVLEQIPAYRDNLFIKACGPILTTEEITQSLLCLPEIPIDVVSMPFEHRQHLTPALKDIFIPNATSVEIAKSVDVMVRQGYTRHRNGTPKFPWHRSSGTSNLPVPSVMSIVGLSGVGKTASINRSLAKYDQVVVHPTMPGFVSEFTQLVYLKVDVPATGKSIDLAYALIEEMERALGCVGMDEFVMSRSRRGPELFRVWQRLANKYMLGIVVLDEVQNLFKEQTLAQRIKHKKTSPDRMDLRLADDETLKMILTAINTWGIPIVLAGTLDCLDIINNRFSTSQRLSLDGHYQLGCFKSADDAVFKSVYFPTLCRYQWVKEPIAPTDEFRKLFFELTGGVPRICTSLWFLTHKYVFQKRQDKLDLQDFVNTRKKYMSSLIPAIDALRANDLQRLMRYEDLLPRDTNLWNTL